MKIVLAKMDDLQQIKDMYSKIVLHMKDEGIDLWNEYYPVEVFQDDINNNQLYLMKDDDVIIGAFVMDENCAFHDDLNWNNTAKAFLLNRIGINTLYLRKGYGKKLIEEACKLASLKGAGSLRLYVADVNEPAIHLYEKCGLKKVNGIYKEKVSDEIFINEYGFEIMLK